MSNEFNKIAFVASNSEAAQSKLQALVRRYGDVSQDQADVIVAVGGDGFMLQTLHEQIKSELPIFGLMAGSIGFLMNRYEDPLSLPERLAEAELTTVHPLQMVVADASGHEVKALAINEVSLLRQARQAAKICIKINGMQKLSELICDGVLVSTAAGSTAYNLSAHGPILPLGANLLALTPISPFRPRRWRGALLSSDWRVRFEVLEPDKRPVSATADFLEVRDVMSVDIAEAKSVTLRMLHDVDHNLEDRILNEQFTA